MKGAQWMDIRSGQRGKRGQMDWGFLEDHLVYEDEKWSKVCPDEAVVALDSMLAACYEARQKSCVCLVIKFLAIVHISIFQTAPNH